MAGFSYIDETTWKYVNPGTADLLSVSGTTVTANSTISRTGTAFYQTTRAKCFDIPAASELWIKTDLYHTGSASSRFRIYNGGSHGTSGICLQTDGNLNIFSNGNQTVAEIAGFQNELLQTYLVHMKSGVSDGLIEFWIDDSLAGTYTGNVNNGDDFADLYFQCDNGTTLFSNVVISNTENVPLIYQARFKPEIYITWIPRGNIAVKPEIFATVYRAPQLVRITAITNRSIKKTDAISADSLRQIGKGEAISGNSSRQIVKTEVISGDAVRVVNFHQNISGDLFRSVDTTYTLSGSTAREIKATQSVSGDTRREVFVFQPELVRITGATVRKIVDSEVIAADTLKRIGTTLTSSFDTNRRINFNVITSVSGDTGRKVVNSTLVKVDTNIRLTRFEGISGDLHRQTGVLNSVGADSRRQLARLIKTTADTRLIFGINQRITAETLRRMNYHVWQVDTSGNVIQINRPRGCHIQIGEARTLSVSDWRVVPDDRQRKIETIGGVVVEDFGHVVAGDRITCTVTLDYENAGILHSYWHSRTFVNVVDESGRIWENLRVLIKSYSYIPYFKNYYRATLEFWKE